MFRWLLPVAVCPFCLALLTACENPAAPDQLTVVQGTVTSADSGRPLPGVLLVIEKFQRGLGKPYPVATSDSVRTDASGQYQLSFRNLKGFYYDVGLEPFSARKPHALDSRFAFASGQAADPLLGPDKQEVTVGKTNTADFQPNELRTVAVRVRNRNTGYQRLDFNYQSLPGNNLDTVAYLRHYYLPPAGIKFRYYSPTAVNQPAHDTLVALAVLNPAARYPDTLYATLTFVR